MTDECSTSVLLGRFCVKPNWIVVFNFSVSVTASAATSKIITMKIALKLQYELQIRMTQ